MRLMILALLLVVSPAAWAVTVAPPPPMHSGGSESGDQLYVSPSGSGSSCTQSSPCSMNQGISQATAGEVVIFLNGTYTNQFVTTRSGNSNNHITFRAQNSRQARIDNNNSNAVEIRHDYITIRGLYITNNRVGASATGCVWVNDNVNNVIFEDLHIFECGNNGFFIRSGSGLIRDIIIRDSLIDEVGWDDFPGEGIYLGGNTANGFLENIVIYNNEIRGWTTNCIDSKDNVTSGWYYNNWCHSDDDAASRGLDSQPHDGSLRAVGQNIYVYNNRFSNLYDGNVFDVSRGNVLVYNNIVYDSPNSGPLIDVHNRNGTGQAKIYNNTFYGLQDYTTDDNGWPPIVVNNIGSVDPDNVSHTQVNANWFVDPNNGDFSLTSNATGAIDQVTGDPFSNVDFNGIPISGSARDYGATEFGTSTMRYVCNSGATCGAGWSTGSNGNSGLSKSDAWQTIDHAEETAPCGTTVTVGNGTYTGTSAESGNAVLWFEKTCTSGNRFVIQAENTGNATIDANGKTRGVQFDCRTSRHTTLSGFAITDATIGLESRDVDDAAPYTRCDGNIYTDLTVHDNVTIGVNIQEDDNFTLSTSLVRDLSGTCPGNDCQHAIVIGDNTSNGVISNNIAYGVPEGWPFYLNDANGRGPTANHNVSGNIFVNESVPTTVAREGIYVNGTSHSITGNIIFRKQDAAGYVACVFNPVSIDSSNAITGNYCTVATLCENGCTDNLETNNFMNQTIDPLLIDPDNRNYALGSPDTTDPSAPTDFDATALSSSRIDLSWTAATDNVGLSGYLVERCVGAGCIDFIQISSIPPFLGASNVGLLPGTTYRYRMRAVDSANPGNIGPYSVIDDATTTTPGNASLTIHGGRIEGGRYQ